MKNDLEQLLINTLDESNDNLINSFNLLINYIQSDKNIFDKIPYLIYQESDNTNDYIVNFLDKKGVLLYDGMHASACGHFNYIYRAKGIRIYLFEDGSVELFCMYCTIDGDGFQYSLEDVDGNNSIDEITNEVVIHYLDFLKYEEFKKLLDLPYNLVLVSFLISINHNYEKAYYLEYLTNPQDVNILSDFSKKTIENLWEICLSDSLENKYGTNIQSQLINNLLLLNIPPLPIQLIEYVNRQLLKNPNIDRIINLFNDNSERTYKKMDDIHDDIKNEVVRNAIRHEEIMEKDIFEGKVDFVVFQFNWKAWVKKLFK